MSEANRIALLRGVNVGGNTRVPMAELKALASDIGLRNPATLLASGNLVFGSDEAPAALEPRLEAAIADRMGVTCAVLVRTAEGWRAVLDANPFTTEAQQRPSVLLIFALRDPPTMEMEAKARATCHAGERLVVINDHAYVDYSKAVGTSRFNPNELGIATGRNWNTALKLAAMTG